MKHRIKRGGEWAGRASFACLAVLLGANPVFAARNCEALNKLTLPKTTITNAEAIPAGSFTPPRGRPIPNLPAFCRVAGVIKPSVDSDIQFEVWMPASGWDGKFQGVGNGGFAGAINYDQMGTAVAHEYATASTDTGHEAGGVDAHWALEHPEKVVDFGYRAIHEMTVDAKAIVHAFYDESPRRSYFSSCSNGGRQALMEAQRYPADYDGILAGAPANYWTHLVTNAVWDLQALAAPGAYIPAKKLPAIQAAALAACDANDGVKDGVIEDPPLCRFDPSVLKCAGPETDACLTAPQLTALKDLYTGGRTSDGKQVFPGYSPGGEADPAGWRPWIVGAAPDQSLMFGFGAQFFKNMVFDDPAWDYHTFNLDRDLKTADAKMSRILNATNPDLGRFKARGGKLILYHGWSDAAIAPQNTINYYESVVAKMGRDNSDGFVRLFMVPGMQHCGGGAGPSSFGDNIDTALEQWVEKGVAPERIIAAKIGPKKEVVRTRPLCAYPLIARYKGSGGTDDAANFACAKAEPASLPDKP